FPCAAHTAPSAMCTSPYTTLFRSAVDKGDADFAFCYGMANDMTYRFLPLFVAHPHAALPAVHPLASGRFVTLEQLAPEPLVVLRSEEHTSELQSRENLVCGRLLED